MRISDWSSDVCSSDLISASVTSRRWKKSSSSSAVCLCVGVGVLCCLFLLWLLSLICRKRGAPCHQADPHPQQRRQAHLRKVSALIKRTRWICCDRDERIH